MSSVATIVIRVYPRNSTSEQSQAAHPGASWRTGSTGQPAHSKASADAVADAQCIMVPEAGVAYHQRSYYERITESGY